MNVLVNEFGHLKHGDQFLFSKDGLKLFICMDHGSFLLILQIIFLNVGPYFLCHLAARDWLGSDDGGK